VPPSHHPRHHPQPTNKHDQPDEGVYPSGLPRHCRPPSSRARACARSSKKLLDPAPGRHTRKRRRPAPWQRMERSHERGERQEEENEENKEEEKGLEMFGCWLERTAEIEPLTLVWGCTKRRGRRRSWRGRQSGSPRRTDRACADQELQWQSVTRSPWVHTSGHPKFVRRSQGHSKIADQGNVGTIRAFAQAVTQNHN